MCVCGGGGVGMHGRRDGQWDGQQMGCILLECILVWQNFGPKLHENERNWIKRGYKGCTTPGSTNVEILYVIFYFYLH